MLDSSNSVARLLESFFIQRLMKQRQASPHTISSYRDTFRLLLRYCQKTLHKPASNLVLEEIDAPLISTFLDELEKVRKNSASSRNVRLAAIRSFFRYAALEAPTHSAQIQRVLAIPSKRQHRPVVSFLTRDEISALLSAPDLSTWAGRRDRTLFLIALQTGLRLSELVSLEHKDLNFGSSNYIRVTGKGRKERCTPLTKQTAKLLKQWIKESSGDNTIVFPGMRGTRLSADGVQYLLSKHVATAGKTCQSLTGKRVTPHMMRHSCAMELLQAGIDRSMIALWLGHESVETTQIYLHANLAMKENILAKTKMHKGKRGRFQPDDQLLAFLTSL
ncbi:MAG: site-specific integrase [Candidatus Obscuribacterales bacterium]|nr:site-specific integrase [Candidatus Obscuribacterales bacterium]